MARVGGKDRGLFERPKGSSIWWIRYMDEDRRERREKVGPKGLAKRLYEKRKTEIREGRYFPPERRRLVLFDEIAKDFLDYASQVKRSARDDRGRMRRLFEVFQGRPVDNISRQGALHVASALATTLLPEHPVLGASRSTIVHSRSPVSFFDGYNLVTIRRCWTYGRT